MASDFETNLNLDGGDVAATLEPLERATMLPPRAFIDPFGHRWGIAQRQEEIPPEEVERQAAVLFGAPAD